jgi:serine/threonine-protein phosphatase CPPED1
MQTRIVPILLVAVLAILAPSCPDKGRSEAFFFMVLADPQFGIISGGTDWVQEEINLGKAVDAANRLRPAFVVVCGDLTHATGDSAQINAYKNAIGRLDVSIPLYQLPGNHDVGNTPTETSLAAYRSSFGHDYYSFHHGDIQGLVFNAPLIKDSGMALADHARQEAWLRAELRPTPHGLGNRVFVFQHQPWFVDSLGEADGYENLPRNTRLRYLRMFVDAGVTHVFSGHLHRNVRTAFGAVQLITTGPVSMALGNDPPGLRIVRIDGGHVTDRYYALDEIPENIEEWK